MKTDEKQDKLTVCLFKSLKGLWQVTRHIQPSRLPANKIISFKGQATFQPQTPVEASYELEYLYQEQGITHTRHAREFHSHQTYLYRLKTYPSPAISVWFPPSHHATNNIAYFHAWQHYAYRKTTRAGKAVILCQITANTHQCAADNYQTIYQFWLKDNQLISWQVLHNAKGPRKNYHIISYYHRS